MAHHNFYVEVWDRAGGLVIRSETTDSAERAKRMARDMKEAGGVRWDCIVEVETVHGVAVTSIHDYELDRLDAIA
jgi:hypothetical protein